MGSGTGGSWLKWIALALLLGVIGLGVKAIWFDQQRYLVPAAIVPEGANLGRVKWHAVPAHLGVIGQSYLDASVRPRGYALATLFPGRLVAKDQIGSFSPESLVRVVVVNKTQLGSGIRSGAIVAIWASARLQSNQFGAPKRLVDRATVSRVIKSSAMFGSQNQQVEVLIPPIETPAVLDATASDSAIFLVARQ